MYLLRATLQWATAVAVTVSYALLGRAELRLPVFFLPKHWTLCCVEVMLGG